ncbi:MAG: DUF2442 domain-containing protein [Lachnospiraceae bacterium]|nr:DUF2442 domain-containing protein [Lachnospiraceae bacterium]MCD7762607.1 DUF2442 domain-containing protein [Lachnospiraceae bacterium]MCD7766461.1 DUF2442 domain-containing protein [Lachnospiraceae bacterium]MCD7841558.1 DUF2442 domain-containing protein [Lachnospiraceae bacterium]
MFEVNGILYAGTSEKLVKIKDAKVTGRKMLLLTFSSGEKRVFDAETLKGEVFLPLDEERIFRNFKIVHGVVTWMNEEIDCAPEYMYEHSYAYDNWENVV